MILFCKRPVFLKIIDCSMICRNNNKNPGGHYAVISYALLIPIIFRNDNYELQLIII